MGYPWKGYLQNIHILPSRYVCLHVLNRNNRDCFGLNTRRYTSQRQYLHSLSNLKASFPRVATCMYRITDSWATSLDTTNYILLHPELGYIPNMVVLGWILVIFGAWESFVRLCNPPHSLVPCRTQFTIVGPLHPAKCPPIRPSPPPCPPCCPRVAPGRPKAALGPP